MYRITISRPGQPDDNRVGVSRDLRQAAYDLLASQGIKPDDVEHRDLVELVGAARDKVDIYGVPSTLRLGPASVVVSPYAP